jgi:anti-sigma regulatory factor (Ser/Thr protein kinase)
MSTLVIRNQVGELGRLNQAIEQFARESGLAAGEQHAIELVLEELVTNAIHHGYPEGGEHELSVGLRMEGRVIEMRVEDDGLPFDPTRAEKADTESSIADRAIGGLGIHLVKNLVHEMVYARRQGRNVLTLRRTVGPDPG